MNAIGGQGINLTWKDALANNDKLRMQVYRDTTDITYNYEYYCYTLSTKKLADYAWSIERLQYDKANNLLARHYVMVPGESSVQFRFQATDLALVKAYPYNDA